jgi:hypothetical protein
VISKVAVRIHDVVVQIFQGRKLVNVPQRCLHRACENILMAVKFSFQGGCVLTKKNT